MNKPLRVAAIQLDIIESDVNSNLLNAQKEILAIKDDVDVAILPEMFTTGFTTDPTTAIAVAEAMDGHCITTMRKWATDYNIAIAASIIVNDNDKIRNRCLFIANNGSIIAFYDKRHLFSMSSETATFTPGNTPPSVFLYKGYRISMVICYDLRFPAWMRNTAPYYDLMIVMANWPDSRAYAWEHLLIARAIENQAYVVGCNRTGSDRWGTYSGTSLIISPKGQPIHSTKGTVLTADIDSETLDSFRKKFPVYLHGDKFTIDT